MSEQNYSYIFRCTNKTEKECIDRMLFGEVEKYWTTLKHIKKGDKIFLYNIDTELLHGSFTAISDVEKNMVTNAWGGEFPVQVKVRHTYIYDPLHKADVDSYLDFRRAYKKYYPEVKIGVDKLSKLNLLFSRGNRKAILVKKEKLIEPSIRTEDGHRVRSQWESDVDNWFTENTIFHYYEKRVNIRENLLCDFFIPKIHGMNNEEVYIELWGKKDKNILVVKKLR